jgi:ubiquinone/menaquinone biosynthesis C-methylase UbiE
MINRDELAKFLMSDTRRKGQNPQVILNGLGIKKGMTLADLGSGPGFFTIPMAEMTGNTGRVYAIDSDSTMLNYLRENIAKSDVDSYVIKIINGDVTHTGIPEKSVDVAFFANMLHDIGDKKAFFEEVKRICKPTAVVVDIDWKKIQTERGPPLSIRLTEEESTCLLFENGFGVIKQIDLEPTHYELICQLAK